MSNWNFDLGRPALKDFADPFGYSRKSEIEPQQAQQKNKKQILEKKLMEVATSGKGQILQIFLMNFMMGNSLNIFLIFFIFQSLYSPIKSMMSVSDVFLTYEGNGINLLQYKLIYLAVNGLLLSIGMYKVYTLGLLPLSAADWIDIVPLHSVTEAREKMSKREQKLIDIAKRFRKLKYRLNNFYQYQVMVNYKHVLLVGDTHQPIGEELIKAFGNTWQIGNIGKVPNEKCHFNLQVDFEEFARGAAKKETIESITQQIEGFSKHFECILCLPGALPNIYTDIKSEAIFEQYEAQRAAIVEPGLLASHIATRHLTNNGSLMFFSDANSFSKSSPQSIAGGIAQEQLCLLNLSLGDREFLEVDAFSYALLQGETNQQVGQTTEQQTKQEESQQQQSQSTQSSETASTSVIQTKKVASKEAQIAKYVKQWADGIKRPISGTFIKFPQKDNFMYPELI